MSRKSTKVSKKEDETEYVKTNHKRKTMNNKKIDNESADKASKKKNIDESADKASKKKNIDEIIAKPVINKHKKSIDANIDNNECMSRRIIPPEYRFNSILLRLIKHIKIAIKNSDSDNQGMLLLGLTLAKNYVKNSSHKKVAGKFAKGHRQWPHILAKERQYFIENGLDLVKTKNKQIKDLLNLAITAILSTQLDENQEIVFWDLLHKLVKSNIHFLNENVDCRPQHFPWSMEEIAKIWNVELGLVVYSD